VCGRQTKRTLAVFFLLFAATIIVGDDFDLDWHTIDGGGEMFAAAGDFTLSGTIGQPDANINVMTGGDFSLSGGFWAGALQEPSPKVPSLFDLLDELDPNDVQPVPPP
jgi:hypothetical protein